MSLDKLRCEATGLTIRSKITWKKNRRPDSSQWTQRLSVCHDSLTHTHIYVFSLTLAVSDRQELIRLSILVWVSTKTSGRKIKLCSVFTDSFGNSFTPLFCKQTSLSYSGNIKIMQNLWCHNTDDHVFCFFHMH